MTKLWTHSLSSVLYVGMWSWSDQSLIHMAPIHPLPRQTWHICQRTPLVHLWFNGDTEFAQDMALGQSFSNWNHLGILLKCKFWLGRRGSGGTWKSVLLTSPQVSSTDHTVSGKAASPSNQPDWEEARWNIYLTYLTYSNNPYLTGPYCGLTEISHSKFLTWCLAHKPRLVLIPRDGFILNQ